MSLRKQTQTKRSFHGVMISAPKMEKYDIIPAYLTSLPPEDVYDFRLRPDVKYFYYF
ncbi:MAG: hypothetical protein MJ252_20140 [archaeon]|nr:hypothetical protein [archaeon]